MASTYVEMSAFSVTVSIMPPGLCVYPWPRLCTRWVCQRAREEKAPPVPEDDEEL